MKRLSNTTLLTSAPMDRSYQNETSKNFLPTSIPAHRSTLTSSMTLSLRREANAFLSVLPLGLCWLQSEVRLRQPDHFT
jgi:hypothetical protein